MLDLAIIRERPDEVRRAMALRHVEAPIDDILALDVRRRSLLAEVEKLKAQRNAVSKEIGKTLASRTSTGAQDVTAREAKIAEMRAVGDQIDALDAQVHETEEGLLAQMLTVPNLPDPRVPEGLDDRDNVEIKRVGEPKGAEDFGFEPLAHWDLGPMLGILDFERGVKLSGSRFYVLNGPGARLQRALITWMLDLHREQGYEERYTPFIVKRECMVGAGQLPKFADNIYHDAEDDLWLVGTAEIPLTNLHRDEILDAEQLPLHYEAYTPCFRREKMSAGRDVRGIKRGHQFDKVEMYKFCLPEESDQELGAMAADAEATCAALGLTYRVRQLCGGDLGFSARITFDIEVWAPGCQEWLEVSSVSNCGDFQARRANVRFRRAKGAKPEFVHTLNGSGLGLPRTLIAVMENYQQKDGSIVVPEVLRPYLGDVGVIR
jgi:seryl-tRNA synthetase